MGTIFRPIRASASAVRFAPMRGVLGSAIPSTGEHGAALAYKSLNLPADADNVYSITQTDAPAGTVLYDDTSADVPVPADGNYSITFTLRENGTDLSPAITDSITVGAAAPSPAPDTTAPAWPTGAAITVSALSSSGYTASWPAATDAVGVTGYRWRINGGAWTNSAGTTATISGRTPGATDTFEVQAFDAVPNYSASLPKSITLQQPADTQAPQWPTGADITITDSSSTGYTAAWPAATDAVGVTGYRWRINGGGWTNSAGTTATISGRTPGTTDAFEVQALDSVPNYSGSLSKSVTLAAGAAVGDAAAVWSYPLPNGVAAGVALAAIYDALRLLTPDVIAAAIGAHPVEGALTHDQVLRLLLAPLAGKASGVGSLVESYFAQDGVTERLRVEFDVSGNRVGVTLNPE